jgi:hypothetical protein
MIEATRVVVVDRDGVPFVALHGEHDVNDAPQLRQLLLEDLAASPRLVLDVSETAFVDSVRHLNGTAPIFRMSAKTGEGVAEWAEWLAGRIEGAKTV